MRLQPGSAALCALDDIELVARVARNDHAAFEVLMRRHNGRLFRVARAILKDAAEAEDALQEAYLDAYRHSGEFRGDAPVATWLTRIVINQALMRLRRAPARPRRRAVRRAMATEPGPSPTGGGRRGRRHEPNRRPTRRCARRSGACSSAGSTTLPVAFRTVFVMRDVEDLSVQETAECLAIPRGDGAHAAVPGPRAAARGAGARPGRGDQRRVRLRRRALRSHRRRRAGARPPPPSA